jgi:hypothetical protein
MAVPLVVHGKTIGVMTLTSIRSDAWLRRMFTWPRSWQVERQLPSIMPGSTARCNRPCGHGRSSSQLPPMNSRPR